MDSLLAQQQEQIDVLRERVRQLEEVLSPPLVVIQVEWGLTPHEAKVFACLAAREQASKEMIMSALYGARGDDVVQIKIVDVFVCKMRKKLKPFGIEISTLWGKGYTLVDRKRFLRGGIA